MYHSAKSAEESVVQHIEIDSILGTIHKRPCSDLKKITKIAHVNATLPYS